MLHDIVAQWAFPSWTSEGVPQALHCSASAIATPKVFGAETVSVKAHPIGSHGSTAVHDLCSVNVTLTHPGTGDRVHNMILLPMSGWNERYQGVGGSGYSAGRFDRLLPIAAEGYACSATDAGHTTERRFSNNASPWALVSDGNINQDLLVDFAYRSLHNMNVVTKQVIKSFYGRGPRYSYWNGCSQGGRQGMVSAQRYPEDYDGILANAPAMQWNDFKPGQQWPRTVMENEGYAPRPCEFAAVQAAVLEACDWMDGVVDGIISAPGICNFDPHSLVGKRYSGCVDGKTRTFSRQTANVVQKIWNGPRTILGDFLWYGITKGTDFSTLAKTAVNPDGTTRTLPFGISDSWYQLFLAKQPGFDTSKITYDDFDRFFLQSHLEYDSTMGTGSPDLSSFRRAGGKMITWHGLADQLIMPQGSMLYYEKVLALDPQAHKFYRQFYAPGVGHCRGGKGVKPLNAMMALRAWVEQGVAPDILPAGSEFAVGSDSTDGTNKRFQNLCAHPQVSKYTGHGDPNLASSYACAPNRGWHDHGEPTDSNQDQAQSAADITVGEY